MRGLFFSKLCFTIRGLFSAVQQKNKKKNNWRVVVVEVAGKWQPLVVRRQRCVSMCMCARNTSLDCSDDLWTKEISGLRALLSLSVVCRSSSSLSYTHPNVGLYFF